MYTPGVPTEIAKLLPVFESTFDDSVTFGNPEAVEQESADPTTLTFAPAMPTPLTCVARDVFMCVVQQTRVRYQRGRHKTAMVVAAATFGTITLGCIPTAPATVSMPGTGKKSPTPPN